MSSPQSTSQAAAPSPRPLPASPGRRIAICLSQFHPTVGGAERQMFQLARLWAQWGHQPVVFTRPLPTLPTRETIDGIEIRRVIRTLDVGPLFGITFLTSLAVNLLWQLRRFDVLLAAQGPWEAVVTGLLAPPIGRLSVVRIASVGPLGDLAQLRRATGAALWRRLLVRNSSFIAPSQQAHSELIDLGCSLPSVHQIANGVDCCLFAPPSAHGSPSDDLRCRTALFAGRLSPVKNPLAVLRAWRLLPHRRRYRLLIAGDGPLAEPLRAYAAQEKLDNIEFLGHVGDMPPVYSRAGVVIQPSPSEGCSNVLLEGMAAGLCPLVSRVPGNLELVRHEETGLAFALDDPRELAAALARLLSDAPLRARLAAAARQHVLAHHGLHEVALRYLALFDRSFASR